MVSQSCQLCTQQLGQLGGFVHQSLKLAYSLGQEADIVGMRVTEHIDPHANNVCLLSKSVG